MVDPIHDDDIDWVCNLMKLRPLDESRRNFLGSMETLDISACPGSGKTTLVVAKLAILARKWKSTTQGLCILSHTNVAREEIEHRLGNTDVGQRLLRYPHFIDTIHGFVSKFLAKPWLASSGYILTAIDNELTFSARKRALGGRRHAILAGFLERHHISMESLRITHADFDTPLAGSDFPSGVHTLMHQEASYALGQAAKLGYFCYDEIFVLGKELLAQHPGVSQTLQHRFPCVLIDEMQDTSELQSAMLSAIFSRDNPDICVMRVGDPNQAIFEQEAELATDSFPDLARCEGIADSFRFDSSIAALANGFAFTAIVPVGLVGSRQINPGEAQIPHTIFIFPDDDTAGVLDAYGQLVLQHLPPQLIATSPITALGAVHKTIDPAQMRAAHHPKTVSHFWQDYVPTANNVNHRPDTLLGYFYAARRQATIGATAKRGIELIAAGLAQMANLLSPPVPFRGRVRLHQHLEEILEGNLVARTAYRALITRVLFSADVEDENTWTASAAGIRHIAAVIGGGNQQAADTNAFLAWTAPPDETQYVEEGLAAPKLNHYRYQHQGAHVDIKLGSIHIAKGETHAATLILETFNRTHFFQALMPWLQGRNQNGARCDNDAKRKRLMEMYVAMTRPTHLLCLAIRNSSLGPAQSRERSLESLSASGWQIHHI
ncbi:UvrD-helicase domain-containing protein [Pseudomonas sp. NA-150]|uniref:UvrD-helicase domain-containing protein n=1 Tax=Pseudomonas sp. NA-150 TaxID=3367525 RepID=UPI0037C5A452